MTSVWLKLSCTDNDQMLLLGFPVLSSMTLLVQDSRFPGVELLLLIMTTEVDTIVVLPEKIARQVLTGTATVDQQTE